ncbi:DUF4349 domain-containing protein [uncultured Pontibacter sp.]|uniref:DUF4349 domain-containing protein n=1 Tax=uncultured Pontibacter sp. TaxID=453356 RepID=UPI00261C0D1C|nr:DUF4349 domain-containing protein [uncultured Pontibacter sp.]
MLATFGCESGNRPGNFEGGSDETEKMLVTPAPDGQVQEVQRKLIKEGRVEFETEDISTTRQTVFRAVQQYKGYISSDQEFKSPGRTSNTLVIRVPAEHYDDLLRDATVGVKKFDFREIDVKDVTEEFLDVEARLKTKKELEARFLELLKQAKNVSEVVEIEKQLSTLRSDIESIEGRLNYLQNQVALSTLSMTFYERTPVYTEFSREFKDGFRNGWNNLIWFFVFLTNIWPFVLLGLALLIGVKVYRSRHRK